MRTKLTIIAIVITCVLAAGTVFIAASIWLGWLGPGALVLGTLLVIAFYVRVVRPWHSRWGATEEEVSRSMPGDGIVPNAVSTTRAISITCPPSEVWPWLVQISYGRAGWYSYDWIDNDGRASADHIIPELQVLKLGDCIEMLPGWGPEVIELVPNRYFIAGDGEGGTWCLAIYPDGDGSRLVSRWRQDWKSNGPASWFFITLADPSAFIMEQKMLRVIKKRAESLHPSLDDGTSAGPRGPQEEVA